MKGILFICVYLCFGRVLLKGWDAFLDILIAQSRDARGFEHVDRACIIDLDSGAKWTPDSHPKALKLSLNEASTIAKVFKRRDFIPFRVKGIYAEGVKYKYQTDMDGKIVFAKKVGNGALTVQRSKTAIVIAHTKEGSLQGVKNKAVRVIAEYLESLGM